MAVFNAASVRIESFENEKELLVYLKSFSVANSIISSVRGEEFTKNVKNALKDSLVLTHETPLPIGSNYQTPNTLGKDRIANAVGAYHIKPNQNNLIIDVGTCLKFDLIDASNQYQGGSISPGLMMRYKSLHTFTDKLPFIDEVKTDAQIGVDTTSSIQVGVYQGMLAEMRNRIQQYEEDYEELNLFLTGGDLVYFQHVELSQKNSIFADNLLTLKGLNTILDYNAKN